MILACNLPQLSVISLVYTSALKKDNLHLLRLHLSHVGCLSRIGDLIELPPDYYETELPA